MKMDLFTAFSSKENLKQAFLYLKDETDNSTLPLDPILRPASSAIAQLGDDYFEALQELIRTDKYYPDKADYIYADKDNMGLRPICIFSVVDRIVFQALLNPSILGEAIDKKLYSSCYGHRVLGDACFLEPYQDRWRTFCKKQIEAFDNNLIWSVEFDLQTYYEAIHIDTLLKTLSEHFQIKDERLMNILRRQLKIWTDRPTECGIPQNANASHVLANAYLHPLDTFVNDLKVGGTFEYFRYVDDVVIMSTNADEISRITTQIALFLRPFNLTLNEKTKLKKLKNTKSIEERIFYNPYGLINETSREKVAKIRKRLPTIIRKIKEDGELRKADLSGLRYYLKAGAEASDGELLSDFISLIPRKPSLTNLICRHVGLHISDEDDEYYDTNREYIHAIYNKIWKTYHDNSLSEWSKFWLLKTMSAPNFARGHAGFQQELSRIIIDPNAKFLRPIAFFFRAYERDMNRRDRILRGESIDAVGVGFSADDLRRQIRKSQSAAEKAIYYYFVIYLRNIEDESVLRNLAEEALRAESPEVQTMGLFLLKKFYRKSAPEILNERFPNGIPKGDLVLEVEERDTLNINLENRELGELCKIFYKLPTPPQAPPEIKQDALLTEDGKIAPNKLAQFFGVSPLKVEMVGKAQEDIATIAAHFERESETISLGKNYPRSIHLITERQTADRKIFLVIDKHFDTPIRFEAKNRHGGDTYMKKLHNISYVGNAPGKRVAYDVTSADSINNKLFLKPQVAECMKTHGLDRPTLVIKSGDMMVLKNEVPVKTGLVHVDVPPELRSLYIDKTS